MKTVRSWRKRRNERERRGYTLLEVLVASLLSVVLLAGLWGLFSLYVGLYQTGEAMTKEAQLVRALMQHFSDDLRSTVQALPNRTSSAGSATTGLDSAPISTNAADAWDAGSPASASPLRIGLVGGLNFLELDVLQTSYPQAPGASSDIEAGPGATLQPAPSDLKKVLYSFQSPLSGGPADPGDLMGLVRQKLDCRVAYAAGVSARLPGPAAAGPASPATGRASGLSLADPFDSDPGDDSITIAPEVIGLEFHYFDGEQWSSEWDSRERQSLPVAVEVAMQIGSPDDYEQGGLAAEGIGYGEQDAALSGLEIHRLVVYLVSAARRSRGGETPVP